MQKTLTQNSFSNCNFALQKFLMNWSVTSCDHMLKLTCSKFTCESIFTCENSHDFPCEN